MSNNSNGTAAARKPKFSEALSTEGYRKLILKTLQDEDRAKRFTASISSAVAANPALQECEPGTILACALLGESLNLSPSPQLGQYYLVPFKDNKNGRTVSTFILGYKGYVQLALRSGQYRKLNVLPIKKGELVYYDPLNEEIEVKLIEDELAREAAETVGYYAFFEYLNGFRKSLYWSRQKMENHALKYSAGYKSDKRNGSKYTFWSRNFDDMAMKTMLRQLIGKWGIMSIEMQAGLTNDGASVSVGDEGELAASYLAGADISDMTETYIGIAGEADGETQGGDAGGAAGPDGAQAEPQNAAMTLGDV